QRVARGILGSAEQQQVTSGDLAGLYPYAWDIVENERSGPFINPEALLDVLYAENRYETGVSVERKRIGGDRVWFASAHTIDNVFHSTTRLRFRLIGPPQDVFTTVAGLDSEPIWV